MCTFANMQMCKCVMCKCVKGRPLLMCKCVNAKCADAQMQRYTSFHLHIFTFAHLHIVKHLLIKRTAYTYASYFFKMQQALWPPKPKVLLRAARTVRFCALLKVKLRL